MKTYRPTLLIIVITAVSLLFGGVVWQALAADRDTAWRQKVDPWVLETAVSQPQTEFLVLLREQADLSGAAALATKAEKGAYVYEQLTAVAQRTQPAVIASLDDATYRRYWVQNMLWVRGDATLVQQLAQRPDVARLYANPSVQLDSFDIVPLETLLEAAVAPEWNIDLVNAPAVWEAGVTGQGVVIGGQDTGYLWSHSGLLPHYRGWVNGSADHNYSWHDAIHSNNPNTQPGNPCGFDTIAPCDDFGHGTHTLGTMVGDDGAGNQVGVAPGARWIGCRNMEQGWGTPASYSECFEWFIAPYPFGGDPFTDGDPAMAPHVINNSWSCPSGEGCTDPNIMLNVVDAVRQAGIVTVQAASNVGPGCGSVSTPAAIYDSSISVGATDSNDNIANFSARGPVTVDGSQRLKPDISAPGVGVRSTVLNGGYGTSNGTSMAAPHVAGLVALLIAADPTLAGDVDRLEMMMTQTAVPRTTSDGCGGDTPDAIPNHTYGWGRIDALAAYQRVLLAKEPLQLTKTASATAVQAGHHLTYTLTVSNVHPTDSQTGLILSDTLPVGTSLVTATLPFTQTDDVIEWGLADLPMGDVWQVHLVVAVSLTNPPASVQNLAYGVVTAEGSKVQGEMVETAVIVHRTYMPLIRKTAVE